MLFDVGNNIFRNGKRYQISIRKDTFVYIECEETSAIEKVTINTLVDEYMEGIVHIDGFDSPKNQQEYISEKQWERIHRRKLFAIGFNYKNVTREQAKTKIRRISRLLNLPPKSMPSRPTCYRWAKLLRDADGDITVLR